MNRIHQTDPATSTGKAEQLFTAVQGKLGFVPNLMRVLGNSPAALEGYLNFSGALAGGVLAPKLRDRGLRRKSDGCGSAASASGTRSAHPLAPATSTLHNSGREVLSGHSVRARPARNQGRAARHPGLWMAAMCRCPR